jgi:acyl-CoA thioesterase-1
VSTHATSRRLARSASALALVLSLVAGCGGDDPAPRRPSAAPVEDAIAEGPLVVFLGDSLSAGLYLDADQAFPALMQRRLAAEGVPFRLVNAGVSGDTTAGGLRRVAWLLKQEPDLVVVELGGNDGLRGIELETIEANLRGILDAVREAGSHAWLLGGCLPGNYGPDYRGAFEALYERVAREEDVPFVPCFLEGVGGVPALNHGDGIHPTAEGHEKLAEKLAPLLRQLLSESR